MRIIRDSLTAVAALLALALLALVAAPPFIDWNRYRVQISEFLSERTGQPVLLGGEIRLVFLPQPELDADLVTIGPAERPLATIGRLTVSLSPLSLARGVVQITGARADRVTLRSEALEIGLPTRATGLRFGLDRLDARDMTLLRAGSEEVLAQGLDLVLEAPDLAGPFRFDLNERTRSREWRGQIGRIEDGRARIRATLEDHGLSARASLEGWVGMPGRADRPAFDGAVQFNGNPLIGEASEGVQWPFDGQARLMVQAGQAIADPVTISAGMPDRALALNGRVFFDFAADRPALRLEMNGRRLDLSGTSASQEGKTSTDRLMQALVWVLSSASRPDAAIPMLDLEAELSLGAIQFPRFVAQDVKFAVGGPYPALRLRGIEARLPAGAELGFRQNPDGQLGLDGVAELKVPDLPALLGALSLEAAGGVPPSGQVRSAIRFANGALQMPDLRLETPGGALAGEMRIEQAKIAPRLVFALAGEHFEARLLSLSDPLRGGAFPIPVEGRVEIDKLRYDGRVLGGIRLAFSREGARARIDELLLRGTAGEELRLSAQMADGTVQATAKLDAEKLDDLAGLAEAVVPGSLTRAIRERAAQLSPAIAVANIRIGIREGESIWDVQTDGRLGGTTISVRTHSELKGSALMLSLQAEAENADGGRLLSQIGGADAGSMRGSGRVKLSLEGNPRRQLATHLDAVLAGTEIEAKGIADFVRTQPFDGTFRLETVDLAPLHRALGGGAPVVAAGTPARISGRYFGVLTKLTLTRFDAEIGPNRIGGEISFDFARGGQVAGQLKMGALDLRTLLAPVLPAGEPIAFHGNRPFPGGRHPFLVGDLWIEAQRLLLTDQFHLDQPKFVLRFAPEIAAIEGLDAERAGARFNATITVGRRDGRLEMAGQIGFERLALPGLSSRIAGEFPFTAQGSHPSGLLASLAGAGRLTLDPATIPHADAGALARLVARPITDMQPLDANRIGTLLEQELRGGSLTLPHITLPITVISGVARLSAPTNLVGQGGGLVQVQPSATIDLPRGQIELRLAMRLPHPPALWRGTQPEIALLWNGGTTLPPAPLRRNIQVSALLNGLLAISLQRELETIEAFEADARERAFFLRRSRAGAEAERQRQYDAIESIIRRFQ